MQPVIAIQFSTETGFVQLKRPEQNAKFLLKYIYIYNGVNALCSCHFLVSLDSGRILGCVKYFIYYV